MSFASNHLHASFRFGTIMPRNHSSRILSSLFSQLNLLSSSREPFDREKLGLERRYRSLEKKGKIKDKEEAPDKRGKARNLSIKSSTKARPGTAERREERARECRLMSGTRQRTREDRGKPVVRAQESRKKGGPVKCSRERDGRGGTAAKQSRCRSSRRSGGISRREKGR